MTLFHPHTDDLALFMSL